MGKTVTLWRTWTPEPPRPFPFFRALNEEEVEEEEEEGEEEDNKILRFFFVTEKKKRNGPIDNRMIRSGQLPAEKKSSQKTHTGCQKKMKIYERKTLRRILLANIDAVVKKNGPFNGNFFTGFLFDGSGNGTTISRVVFFFFFLFFFWRKEKGWAENKF